ncbi:MAG: hypothetical protein KA521_06000 [Crocinitomicaceae bacterium]|nr:hypothetical protein [Crocinitomicaceae bacterium]
MRKTLFTNWNFMRFARLLIGIYIVVQGIQTKEISYTIMGSLFMLMPIFNIGCFGGQCASPIQKTKNESSDINEVEFEEIL